MTTMTCWIEPGELLEAAYDAVRGADAGPGDGASALDAWFVELIAPPAAPGWPIAKPCGNATGPVSRPH